MPGFSSHRRVRNAAVGLFAAVLVYFALAATGLFRPALAFDLVTNLAPAPEFPELRAAEPGSVVILLHGLWRSQWSLWRLERTLESHGYEVWSWSYPSTRKHIDEHAAELEARIEQHVAERGAPPRLHFVAHSMGGVVTRAYLARPDARAPLSVVCMGTPHQGATRAGQLADRWYFRMVMGSRAAVELAPSSGVVDTLPAPDTLGNIIGASGNEQGRSRKIPGDDDGTVAVAEAHHPAETDACLLDIDHTWLMIKREGIRQVLYFLKHERFDD